MKVSPNLVVIEIKATYLEKRYVDVFIDKGI